MARDPNIEKAYKLWIEAGGNNSSKGILESIAEKLGKTPATIRSWKSRYKWGKEKSATQQKKECNATKNATKKKKKEKVVSDIDILESKHISEVIKENELDEIIGESLTEKQKIFCWYYSKSFNVKSSALKAGYSLAYSTSKIYELLQSDKMKSYIEEIKEKMFNKIEINAERIYERHCNIAFSDTSDFLNLDGTLKNLVEVDGTLIKKVTTNSKKETMKRFNSEGITTSIKNIDEAKTTLELEDRSKSLDFLTKFHGLDPKLELEKERLKNGAGDEKEEKLSISEMRKKYGL